MGRFYIPFLLLVLCGGYVTPSLASIASWDTDSTDQPVFYEPIGQRKFRFYYDDRYYLADKFCGFTAIVRETGFDPAGQVFDGPFVDYNLAGQKILTGTYERGLKTGAFKAFHTNGQLKWEANFEDGQPVGLWQYYYPDGKPMLVLVYTDQGMEIQDFWNLKGSHKVKNGKGRYEMRIEIDGYNEYGAVYILRRGRVRNGKPNGLWPLEFVYENGQREYIGNDLYRDGRIMIGEAQYLDGFLRGMDRLSLTPLPWFTRAEDLAGKKCTIDEYSGFTAYLEWYLEDWLNSRMDPAMLAQKVTFSIPVDKTGKPGKIVPLETLSEKTGARVLMESLQAITFWPPSFRDGDYIDDELTLSFEIHPDAPTESVLVYFVDIKRKNGT